MKNIVLAFCFMGAIFSIDLLAQADTVVCNDCSEKQQIRAVKYSSNIEKSNVVVVDFYNETANKYQVYRSEDRYGKPTVNVYRSKLSREEISDTKALFLYRKELIKMIQEAEAKSRRDFPDAYKNKAKSDDHSVYAGSVVVHDSPYDFISNSFIRNDIYDYYFSRKTSFLTQILSNTFKTIKIPNIKDIGVHIEIKFYSDLAGKVPNGFISVSIDTAKKSFEVLAGRDGFNNTIPVNPNKISGGYLFGGDEEKNKFETYIFNLTASSGSKCGVVSKQKVRERHIFTYRC